WLSLGGCSLFFASGVYALATVQYDASVRTQVTILTTLVGLAILEHLFMVLPVADNRLWSWAMGVNETSDTKFETTVLDRSGKEKSAGRS
ncbi:MAG: DUF3623 family protein, partial [Pseudomonadota bacterium]